MPAGLVAVVEDDAIARQALGRLLDAGGFNPALFESAESFLPERHREWLCVIADVQLTGMSGIDLQCALRSEALLVPVIVITGHRADAVRDLAERAGCAAFLSKPFSGAAILTLLDEIAAGCPTCTKDQNTNVQ
jgi:FixJ family two-component response regulator